MSFRFRGRNRGLRLRPVNRIKHVVDSQFGISAGGTQTTTVIQASDTPDLATVSEVQTGATVNGIFLVVECYARTDAALANVYLAIFKNPGGNLTNPSANQIGISDDKRFVIHQEMVMIQRAVNGNPRTVFKGVIVLPRGYRRFGPNDLLNVIMKSPGVDVDACLQVHYKEFR